jgi:hypothetical protein
LGKCASITPSLVGEVDLRLGFDDEEGVGVGEAGGAEFLAGFVEGGGERGEDDAAVGAADEMEAELVVDELERFGHASGAIGCVTGSIHRIALRIKIKMKAGDGNFDLYQIGTEAD